MAAAVVRGAAVGDGGASRPRRALGLRCRPYASLHARLPHVAALLPRVYWERAGVTDASDHQPSPSVAAPSATRTSTSAHVPCQPSSSSGDSSSSSSSSLIERCLAIDATIATPNLFGSVVGPCREERRWLAATLPHAKRLAAALVALAAAVTEAPCGALYGAMGAVMLACGVATVWRVPYRRGLDNAAGALVDATVAAYALVSALVASPKRWTDGIAAFAGAVGTVVAAAAVALALLERFRWRAAEQQRRPLVDGDAGGPSPSSSTAGAPLLAASQLSPTTVRAAQPPCATSSRHPAAPPRAPPMNPLLPRATSPPRPRGPECDHRGSDRLRGSRD